MRTLRFTNESDRRLHVGVEVNDPGAPGIGRAMDPGESGDISVLVRPGVADLTVEVEEMNFFSIGEPRERQEPCPDRTTRVMLVNRTRWLLRMTVTALGTEAPLELRPGMGLAGELLIPDEASEASIVVHEAVAVEPETPQEEEAIRRAKELMDWWRSGFDEIESMRERAPTEPDE